MHIIVRMYVNFEPIMMTSVRNLGQPTSILEGYTNVTLYIVVFYVTSHRLNHNKFPVSHSQPKKLQGRELKKYT